MAEQGLTPVSKAVEIARQAWGDAPGLDANTLHTGKSLSGVTLSSAAWPASVRNRLDLPEPLRPMRATRSPSSSWKLT